jgi:hypothetical protein
MVVLLIDGRGVPFLRARKLRAEVARALFALVVGPLSFGMCLIFFATTTTSANFVRMCGAFCQAFTLMKFAMVP